MTTRCKRCGNGIVRMVTLEFGDILALSKLDFDPETEVTLSIGGGHSGDGLYFHETEYPEEGSTHIDDVRRWADDHQAAKAELAAERSKSCEGCRYWRTSTNNGAKLAYPHCEHSEFSITGIDSDFACNRFEAKP